MSVLDDLVQKSLDEQKQVYINQINDQKASAEAEIASKAMELQKTADNLEGFKIGIIAPAYQGYQSSVLERDPLRGSQYTSSALAAPTDQSQKKINPIVFVIAGFIAFHWFKSKRRA